MTKDQDKDVKQGGQITSVSGQVSGELVISDGTIIFLLDDASLVSEDVAGTGHSIPPDPDQALLVSDELIIDTVEELASLTDVPWDDVGNSGAINTDMKETLTIQVEDTIKPTADAGTLEIRIIFGDLDYWSDADVV